MTSLVFAVALIATNAPPPPAPAPAPAPDAESVKALVGKLATCVEMDCAALKALIAKGDKVWPDIQVGLDDPDEMTRFWSIGVLTEVPLAAARPKLIALAKDPTVRIRAAAAFALGAQRSPEVVPTLIESLADGDVNVRFEAASALIRVPDPRALDPLIKAATDQDEDVRQAACEALGGIKDERAAKTLLDALLNDRKPVVRGHAAIGLGVMRWPAAVDALIKRAAREKDPEALGAMAWALGEIGDKKAVPTLEGLKDHSSDVVRNEVSDALAKLAKVP